MDGGPASLGCGFVVGPVDGQTVEAHTTILVLCQPRTGYRHQIRAHLAALGWPIANDVTYGGTGDNDKSRLQAYVDDDEGTLRRALLDPAVQRDWCPKCHWVKRQILSTDNNNDDNVTSSPIYVDGPIWLACVLRVVATACVRSLLVVVRISLNDFLPFLFSCAYSFWFSSGRSQASIQVIFFVAVFACRKSTTLQKTYRIFRNHSASA